MIARNLGRSLEGVVAERERVVVVVWKGLVGWLAGWLVEASERKCRVGPAQPRIRRELEI